MYISIIYKTLTAFPRPLKAAIFLSFLFFSSMLVNTSIFDHSSGSFSSSSCVSAGMEKRKKRDFFFFLVRRGAACVCVGRGIVCCCLRSKEERSRKEIEACRWKEEENRRVALSACHSLVAVERASYCQRNKRERGRGGG